MRRPFRGGRVRNPSNHPGCTWTGLLSRATVVWLYSALENAGVKKLFLLHFDPAHTDSQVAESERQAAAVR